jgi:hypothetical protein
MKDQYFGDVNDYRKYGLLRILSGIRCDGQSNISVAICWMLTPNDGRSDGGKINYEKLRKFDPDFFDCLIKLLPPHKEKRQVKSAKEGGFLPPSTLFYPEILFNERGKRFKYFNKFLREAKTADLLFFDPDNGMNVKSRRYGNQNSSKYLYWCELICSFWAGHSILIYQHFRRTKGIDRDQFIAEMANEIIESIGVNEVLSFRTPHVVFFLLPQDRDLILLKKHSVKVTEIWVTKQIKLEIFSKSGGGSEPSNDHGKTSINERIAPMVKACKPCPCGCGGFVEKKNRTFIMGHDGKLTSLFRKVLRKEIEPDNFKPIVQETWRIWNEKGRPGGEIHPKLKESAEIALTKNWEFR